MKIEKKIKKVFKVLFDHNFNKKEFVFADNEEDARKLVEKVYASRSFLSIEEIEINE